jgi:hypothetical protein
LYPHRPIDERERQGSLLKMAEAWEDRAREAERQEKKAEEKRT